MRLTKGNKVEVFSTKHVPSGAWYPAEIIHGNGHNYTVKYDGGIGSQGEEVFDRVPRKAIRQDVPPKQKWKSYFRVSKINSGQEIYTNSSQCLKRKLKNCPSQSQKIRVIEKDRKQNHFISLRQPPLREKVDAVGSHLISIYSRGADSITSSVASCSVSGINIRKVPENFQTGCFEDNECNSDAESFCQMGSDSKEKNCLLLADEKLTQDVHRTERRAYRSIIEALYASGPLNWEQEASLTNLRSTLHITNDEHLMEIRNLASTSTCIPAR